MLETFIMLLALTFWGVVGLAVAVTILSLFFIVLTTFLSVLPSLVLLGIGAVFVVGIAHLFKG